MKMGILCGVNAMLIAVALMTGTQWGSITLMNMDLPCSQYGKFLLQMDASGLGPCCGAFNSESACRENKCSTQQCMWSANYCYPQKSG